MWKSIEKIKNGLIEKDCNSFPRPIEENIVTINEQNTRILKDDLIEIKDRLKELSIRMEQREKNDSIPARLSSSDTKPILNHQIEKPLTSDFGSQITNHVLETSINHFYNGRSVCSKEIQVSLDFDKKLDKEDMISDDYSYVNFESQEKTSPESNRMKNKNQEKECQLTSTPFEHHHSTGTSPIKMSQERSKISNEPSSDFLKETKQEDRTLDSFPIGDPFTQIKQNTFSMNALAEKLAEISDQLRELKNNDHSKTQSRLKSVRFQTPKDHECLPSTAITTKHNQLPDIEDTSTPTTESEKPHPVSLIFNDFLSLLESLSIHFEQQGVKDKHRERPDESKSLLLSKFIEALSSQKGPNKVDSGKTERLVAQRDVEQAAPVVERPGSEVDRGAHLIFAAGEQSHETELRRGPAEDPSHPGHNARQHDHQDHDAHDQPVLLPTLRQ